MEKWTIKKDIIFVIGILFLALFLWGIPLYLNGKQADSVKVIQDGEIIGTYPLNEENTVIIKYGNDEYNILLINEGKAFMSDADCPDKLCVKQRAISKNGESIICLPHKLIIQIVAKEESDLDAVTY